MSRRRGYGIHRYRGCVIYRKPWETAAIFLNGTCIESGLPTIQAARIWIDANMKRG